MRIETTSRLYQFRRFVITSTCQSFMPEEYLRDESVFPERPQREGRIYVEAGDKVLLGRVGEMEFVRATNVLGVIYNSKSGRTSLRWRQIRGDLGKVTGEASANSLVNLYASGVLGRDFLESLRASGGREA
ncbi:MAG: hypothetical protein QXU06_03680 [Candidatus Bathyarchaeia archaeon]